MRREVGNWVHVNEEAIHGTRAVAMGDQKWIEATRTPGKTFLFVLDSPTTGKLWVPLTAGEVGKAYILPSKKRVKLSSEGDARYVELRNNGDLNPRGTVIVLEHDKKLSFDQRKWVVPGVVNERFPHAAALDGVEFEPKVRWMEIFGDWQSLPSPRYWKEGAGGATWRFYSPEGGRCFSDIEFSAVVDGDLKEGILSIDAKEQPFVTVYTGDSLDSTGEGRHMPRYMKRRFGMMDIPSGEHTLAIRRNYEGKTGWIRLSKVSLTPVD